MIELLFPLTLLVVTYATGAFVERRHLDRILRREERLHSFQTVTLRRPPAALQVEGAELVSGSVVISIDYFKRFLAGLRALVGGRIRSFEGLLDRARREALLRMREQAVAKGYDMVIHVRLETTRIASSGARDTTAGVEVLAFGTALKVGLQ